MIANTFKTERLILRPWQEADLKPFAEMNADPRVREFFPRLLTEHESDASVKLIEEHIEKYGWGLWAASLADTDEFIGFIGLEHLYFSLENLKEPVVEIGWRLAFDHWGKGYATEGGIAVLRYGFETLCLPEIVSITAVKNERSRHVMEKIGMHHDSRDDFDHPRVPEDSELRRQVLYRLTIDEWKEQNFYYPTE